MGNHKLVKSKSEHLKKGSRYKILHILLVFAILAFGSAVSLGVLYNNNTGFKTYAKSKLGTEAPIHIKREMPEKADYALIDINKIENFSAKDFVLSTASQHTEIEETPIGAISKIIPNANDINFSITLDDNLVSTDFKTNIVISYVKADGKVVSQETVPAHFSNTSVIPFDLIIIILISFSILLLLIWTFLMTNIPKLAVALIRKVLTLDESTADSASENEMRELLFNEEGESTEDSTDESELGKLLFNGEKREHDNI
jgi:hypothetical protein